MPEPIQKPLRHTTITKLAKVQLWGSVACNIVTIVRKICFELAIVYGLNLSVNMLALIVFISLAQLLGATDSYVHFTCDQMINVLYREDGRNG